MQNSLFLKPIFTSLERQRKCCICDDFNKNENPSYLNGQHHNGQRSSHIDVQFKVVNYRRVAALWTHKDVTLSRESIGYKLTELQRQLK